ncbi:hypothetical protein HaLaN_11774 [Haematococcus lacustris]|uniref:Uncharacterized protein n=1 Tax=Haematococcus lacustris TaxID=44745 RepID=A0A699YZ15_HAELA|nr:hypothetical protein HaLaN_11774 [Haematococcus lacustris]
MFHYYPNKTMLRWTASNLARSPFPTSSLGDYPNKTMLRWSASNLARSPFPTSSLGE